jgi:hypothetical protein
MTNINMQISSIFNHIEENAKNLDNGLLKECLNEFEFSHFSINEKNGELRSMNHKVTLESELRSAYNCVIQNRLNLLKKYKIQANLTYHSFGKLLSLTQDMNQYKEIFNGVMTILNEKRIVLINLKEKSLEF